MDTVIYTNEQSPPGRAVKMLMHILGLNFDIRYLNPVLREQDTTEMKKKNPLRTIPFIDEGDFTLSDSHAICIYLVEKYGKPEHEHLYPKDRRKRATVHQRLFLDCGILFQRLRAVMAGTYMGRMTELTKEVIGGIKNAYSILEGHLLDTKYLADDDVTIADICALSTVSSLDGLVPVDGKRYPKTKQWLQAMYEKEFCKKANEDSCKLHVETLKEIMEFNKKNAQSKL